MRNVVTLAFVLLSQCAKPVPPKASPADMAESPADASGLPRTIVLRKPVAPRATIGDLEFTLEEVREIAIRKNGRRTYERDTTITVRRGQDVRRIQLENHAEVFGAKIDVTRNVSGEKYPGGPLEDVLELEVQ
jgi:hypothetical protein